MDHHGALREPRRAAGVEDDGEIVAPLILDGQRPAVRERDPGLDEVPGAGVLHHVGHLFRDETEVHRNDDRAREHGPPEGHGPVAAVRQAKGHPVAGLHPGFPQAARHPGRPVPQLGVGHPVPAYLHQRLAGGVPVDRPAQGLHKVLRKRAVPSGTVGATLDVACVEGVVHQRIPFQMSFRIGPELVSGPLQAGAGAHRRPPRGNDLHSDFQETPTQGVMRCISGRQLPGTLSAPGWLGGRAEVADVAGPSGEGKYGGKPRRPAFLSPRPARDQRRCDEVGLASAGVAAICHDRPRMMVEAALPYHVRQLHDGGCLHRLRLRDAGTPGSCPCGRRNLGWCK